MPRSIARDTIQSIKRNRVMSLASVFSIMAALMILGFFLIMTINVQQTAANVESNLKIQVFLKQDCTEEDKAAIVTAMEENPLIASVQFETRREALGYFSESLDEYSDLLSSYDETNNPMPESYVIRVLNADEMGTVKQQIIDLENPGIEYVKYGEEYVEALTNFNEFAQILSVIVIIVLSIISFFLIYNTIKITVFARRKEIRIMKYVGATDMYIRLPFVFEGMSLGIIAALVALLALRSSYFAVLGFLNGSALMSFSNTLANPNFVISQLVVFFLVYGVAIGAIGSIFAIRKFLDV